MARRSRTSPTGPAGCSGQNSDENEPLIVTFTENGTAKVVTTGP
jgi:hypothetical protein